MVFFSCFFFYIVELIFTSIFYFSVAFLHILLIFEYFFPQYDTHLTELEKKISLVQERALEQAEMDLGADDENYTIAEPDSREVNVLFINAL